MKNFIVAAMLFAVLQAHAEVIAITGTKAGGEIRLTNQQSNCPSDSRWFYTTTREGEVHPGCWSLVDGDVFATYRDGSIRLYPMDVFILKKPPVKPRSQSL